MDEKIVKDSQGLAKDLVNDCISRYGVAAWLDNMGYTKLAYAVMDKDRFPSVHPEKRTDKHTKMHACDLIDRQAAIDAMEQAKEQYFDRRVIIGKMQNVVSNLPSAQPERTCVNCGRTANNGGWYADGGTRCPIEEHYALPKDGFCHLWEKRNVTDDDYPERRTDD